MALEVFNRQELKFIIDHQQYDRIRESIAPSMRLDKHNKDGKTYRLHNLYIDTSDHTLIRNSLTKPIYKEKLRLRSYTGFTANDPVYLEIKKRYKRITNKRRTQLPFREALAFIESGHYNGNRDTRDTQVIREFETILSQADYFPKTYITYDRLALHSKDEATDLRITFDTNLTARRYDQPHTTSLLQEHRIIMELKSIQNIPLWLVAVLADSGVHKQSFSKYGQEYISYLQSEPLTIKGAKHA